MYKLILRDKLNLNFSAPAYVGCRKEAHEIITYGEGTEATFICSALTIVSEVEAMNEIGVRDRLPEATQFVRNCMYEWSLSKGRVA